MTTVSGFNLISAQTLFNKELPKIEYLVDKLIIKRGLTYFVGPPASFKTGLLLLSSILGATKTNVLGFKVDKPFRTLFIDEENGQIGTKDKLVKLLNGAGIDIKELSDNKLFFSIISGFQITQPYIDKLIDVIKQYKPDLIVIDNIARCMVGNERDEQDVTKILGLLKPLIETYEISIVIIHHTRKNNDNNLESISGSRDFGAQCDNAFLLQQCGKRNDIKTFLLKQVKCKHNVEIDSINFNVYGNDNTLHVEYLGTAKDNMKSIVQKIRYDLVEWLVRNKRKEYKTKELTGAMISLGYKDSSIRTAIDELVRENMLVNPKYGFYSVAKGDK